MTASEKTNNVSVDQVAAKLNGHHTRYPSLVLGTEGGTGSYGSAKTLSHYGPGRPIPSMHRPQEIFNRLFKPYAGRGVEQVRADLKREASVLDLSWAADGSTLCCCSLDGTVCVISFGPADLGTPLSAEERAEKLAAHKQ